MIALWPFPLLAVQRIWVTSYPSHDGWIGICSWEVQDGCPYYSSGPCQDLRLILEQPLCQAVSRCVQFFLSMKNTKHVWLSTCYPADFAWICIAARLLFQSLFAGLVFPKTNLSDFSTAQDDPYWCQFADAQSYWGLFLGLGVGGESHRRNSTWKVSGHWERFWGRDLGQGWSHRVNGRFQTSAGE